MKKKKNKFTLVEVLIAIFLVTGACFFLLRFEESYILSARQSLKKVQRELRTQEAYVRLFELLFTNQIPWKLIEDAKSYRYPLEAADWEVEATFTPVPHTTTDTITHEILDVKVSITLLHRGEKESSQPEVRLCLKKEEQLHVEAS